MRAKYGQRGVLEIVKMYTSYKPGEQPSNILGKQCISHTVCVNFLECVRYVTVFYADTLFKDTVLILFSIQK